jgi:hypothetical protein
MSGVERLDGRRGIRRRNEDRLGQSLSSSALERRVAITHIDAVADVQAAKVDAVAFVGRIALQDVALLSQTEQQLATLVPMSTTRLAAIADITALAIAEVVVDTTRRLR